MSQEENQTGASSFVSFDIGQKVGAIDGAHKMKFAIVDLMMAAAQTAKSGDDAGLSILDLAKEVLYMQLPVDKKVKK